MSTQNEQNQASILESNQPWIQRTAERMLSSVDEDGIDGDPAERTLAVMVSMSAITLAFSALRGQFRPDDKVKEMLREMVDSMSFDEHETPAA